MYVLSVSYMLLCLIFASFVRLVYLLHYEVDGMPAMHLTQCCMFVGTKRTLKSNM
jgi:hypothetical protein